MGIKIKRSRSRRKEKGESLFIRVKNFRIKVGLISFFLLRKIRISVLRNGSMRIVFTFLI